MIDDFKLFFFFFENFDYYTRKNIFYKINVRNKVYSYKNFVLINFYIWKYEYFNVAF